MRRGPKCTVCSHPDLAAIDAALVGGASNSAVAAQYGGFQPDAARRHRHRHLARELVAAEGAREAARADSLLDQLRALAVRAAKIADAAEKERDWRAACAALREVRACLETLSRVAGELRPEGAVGLVPGVVTPRTTVLVLLPSNGRAPGLPEVSLTDVVAQHGLYPIRGDDELSATEVEDG